MREGPETRSAREPAPRPPAKLHSSSQQLPGTHRWWRSRSGACPRDDEGSKAIHWGSGNAGVDATQRSFARFLTRLINLASKYSNRSRSVSTAPRIIRGTPAGAAWDPGWPWLDPRSQ